MRNSGSITFQTLSTMRPWAGAVGCNWSGWKRSGFSATPSSRKGTSGTFASDAARTYTFTVKLASTTSNDDQNKTATAVYTWDSVQLDGTESNQ